VNQSGHVDIGERRIRVNGETLRQVTTWINGERWMLVVQQPEQVILAPVNAAVLQGGLIAALALLLVGLSTLILTSSLISRVERADRERDVMYGDLLRAAKLASLGEMATGLAHEINNPLAIIGAEQTNLADEIDELELAPEARASFSQSVERCRRQVLRCGEITGKMLQFGRNTETVLRPTDIGPAVREALVLLERRARARNVTLRLELAPDLPPALVDANELEQVLVNLVNNGLDALPRGGCITVSARPVDGRLLLQVQDNGSGISSEDLDRVFQPFFTTKPVGQGTGLGLAVVYGIVRGWGGSVAAESELGRGTVMSIRIPAAADTQMAGIAAERQTSFGISEASRLPQE
jgi:two-component system NtrC family sensor kinase